MYFAGSDVYPRLTNVLTTSEQTVPDHDEQNYEIDQETATNATTNQSSAITYSDKKLFFSGLLLLVGVMFVLHFID